METVLLHKSAFLYVTSIFRLSSFVFANALLTGITKTFVPFYSSFPEICSNFAYENYYKDFFDTLDKGTQEKVLYGLLLLKTQDRLPAKYVKFLKEGLYELRIEWQGNIYRIFFCYDEGHIVILFNGFQKKTQKTPDREIDKALKLKKEYYERKRTKDV